MSQDGKSIFTVLYIEDENLKITASKDKISKSLNFELSDLLSIEPVDNTLRPMRLNYRLWKAIDDDEDENNNNDSSQAEGGKDG